MNEGGVEQIKVMVGPTGLITRKDFGKMIGRTSKTLCEWAGKGKGPRPVAVGGRIFYRWAEAQEFAGGVQ